MAVVPVSTYQAVQNYVGGTCNYRAGKAIDSIYVPDGGIRPGFWDGLLVGTILSSSHSHGCHSSGEATGCGSCGGGKDDGVAFLAMLLGFIALGGIILTCCQASKLMDYNPLHRRFNDMYNEIQNNVTLPKDLSQKLDDMKSYHSNWKALRIYGVTSGVSLTAVTGTLAVIIGLVAAGALSFPPGTLGAIIVCSLIFFLITTVPPGIYFMAYFCHHKEEDFAQKVDEFLEDFYKTYPGVP